MNVKTGNATRYLPTGIWVQVGEDAWRKACGRCGGEGWIEGYRYIESGICFECRSGGFAHGVKARSTKELDAKERADIRAAERKAAKAEAKAAIALAKYAEREAREAEAQAVKDAERAKVAEASKYLDAAVGSKVEVSGVVTTARSFEAEGYGYYSSVITKRIIAVDLGDGVTVKTFTQAAWAFDVNEGDQVTIKATVKGFGEYEGVKETKVARPSLVSKVAA